MTKVAEAQIIANLPNHYWTIDQYHAMIKAGIFTSEDKVELLFGKIVPMSPVGIFHAATVRQITRLFIKHLEDDMVVGTQDPITLPNDSEPEPDIFVASGPSTKYKKHHPYPSDLLLVVEVSDTTLSNDRTAKRYNYATAGIKEYWIVNAFERQVEQYLSPQQDGNYDKRAIFKENQVVNSPSLGDFKVADLFP